MLQQCHYSLRAWWLLKLAYPEHYYRACKRSLSVVRGGSASDTAEHEVPPYWIKSNKSTGWWKAVIGLELHAQIKAERKLFSGMSGGG
jgi:hypothetical protein